MSAWEKTDRSLPRPHNIAYIETALYNAAQILPTTRPQQKKQKSDNKYTKYTPYLTHISRV